MKSSVIYRNESNLLNINTETNSNSERTKKLLFLAGKSIFYYLDIFLIRIALEPHKMITHKIKTDLN